MSVVSYGPTELAIETQEPMGGGTSVARFQGEWETGIDIAVVGNEVWLQASPRTSAGEADRPSEVHRASSATTSSLVGTLFPGGPFVAGGGHVFMTTRTGGLVRHGVKADAWTRVEQRPDAIAVDADGAVLTDKEAGRVLVWPHAGKPFVACENLAGITAIALTKDHVYFTAFAHPLPDKNTVVGRFPRPR